MIIVLILDDNLSLRKTMRYFLERSHFEVWDASDANQALALAHVIRFDVIVTDIGMPWMDGVEFLSELRKFSGVPVVALTGKADVRVHQAGFTRVVDKPTDMASFAELLRTIMKGPAS